MSNRSGEALHMCSESAHARPCRSGYHGTAVVVGESYRGGPSAVANSDLRAAHARPLRSSLRRSRMLCLAMRCMMLLGTAPRSAMAIVAGLLVVLGPARVRSQLIPC